MGIREASGEMGDATGRMPVRRFDAEDEIISILRSLRSCYPNNNTIRIIMLPFRAET